MTSLFRSAALYFAATCFLHAMPHTAVASEPTKVSVAQASLSFNFIPMYVAQGRGFFKDEGLDLAVSMAGGGPAAVSALLSGGADLALFSTSDAVNVLRRGNASLRGIAVTMNGIPAALTISRGAADRIKITPDAPLEQRKAALKGLSLAIQAAGGIEDFIIRAIALSSGINPDRDIRMTPVSDFQAVLAGVKMGRVDGCICPPPSDTILQRESGAIPLIVPERDLPQTRDMHLSLIFTTQKYADANPQVLEKVVRAVARAEKLIADEPEVAKALTRKFFERMDDKSFDAAWTSALPQIPRNPIPTVKGFEVLHNFQKLVGFAPQTETLDFATMAASRYAGKDN
ncbi:ABC transporter substrate-binding protein [Pseudorhodoplanes sp.]|uniref:ABC transporter substrate-binding protein n=1 Tax=Pseudorhodoplanes sp. TaxID=1934341 RepID=UPI002B733E61|nr:ABC transporter substrate-binding protein [Pseudorhodoplanes sp.]HWV51029.1 ABC transporter substrate-binding protein [Pseudorhodoplanes sp.]